MSNLSEEVKVFISYYTYEGVVLAADGAGVAGRAAANADDGDGRAVNTEEDVQVGQDDAEQTEQRGARGRVRLQNTHSHLSVIHIR